jgi:hypothetical protein
MERVLLQHFVALMPIHHFWCTSIVWCSSCSPWSRYYSFTISSYHISCSSWTLCTSFLNIIMLMHVMFLTHYTSCTSSFYCTSYIHELDAPLTLQPLTHCMFIMNSLHFLHSSSRCTSCSSRICCTSCSSWIFYNSSTSSTTTFVFPLF